MLIFVVGALKAIALLFILARMDIRKFLGYPVLLDTMATILFALLMFGTYSGVAAAVVAGLIFSAMVTVLRRTMGYKRLTRKGWVDTEAKWSMGNVKHRIVEQLNA